MTARVHDSLNFYYCYLLLKTYFPKSVPLPVSLDNLLPQIKSHLAGKKLQSEVSKTHHVVYQAFLDAGIAALK